MTQSMLLLVSVRCLSAGESAAYSFNSVESNQDFYLFMRPHWWAKGQPEACCAGPKCVDTVQKQLVWRKTLSEIDT